MSGGGDEDALKPQRQQVLLCSSQGFAAVRACGCCDMLPLQSTCACCSHSQQCGCPYLPCGAGSWPCSDAAPVSVMQ